MRFEHIPNVTLARTFNRYDKFVWDVHKSLIRVDVSNSSSTADTPKNGWVLHFVKYSSVLFGPLDVCLNFGIISSLLRLQRVVISHIKNYSK